jgi:hypothetical protein
LVIPGSQVQGSEKMFEPWRDTINLLSGGKAYHAARPGEPVEIPEQFHTSQRVRFALFICRVRERLSTRYARNCHKKTETHDSSMLERYRKRYP